MSAEPAAETRDPDTVVNLGPRRNWPPDVRFGKRDNQVLRLDVAEALLTRWAQKKPKDFGDFLAAVLLGDEAVDARKNI